MYFCETKIAPAQNKLKLKAKDYRHISQRNRLVSLKMHIFYLPSTLFHLLPCVSLFVLVAAVHHCSRGDFILVESLVFFNRKMYKYLLLQHAHFQKMWLYIGRIFGFFKIERCTNICYCNMHILCRRCIGVNTPSKLTKVLKEYGAELCRISWKKESTTESTINENSTIDSTIHHRRWERNSDFIKNDKWRLKLILFLSIKHIVNNVKIRYIVYDDICLMVRKINYFILYYLLFILKLLYYSKVRT
jgi:hypothetical protein